MRHLSRISCWTPKLFSSLLSFLLYESLSLVDLKIWMLQRVYTRPLNSLLTYALGDLNYSLIPGNFRVKHTESYSTSNSPQKRLLDATPTSRHFNTENLLSSQLGFLLFSFMSVGPRRHGLFLLLYGSLCSGILSALTLSSLMSSFYLCIRAF